MLPHAALILLGPDDESVAIPVVNFSILPVGSDIELHITDEVFFEGYIIKNYTLDSTYGVLVDVAHPRPEGLEEFIERDWQQLHRICVPDPSGYCTWVYPKPINFGVKFPLPPI